MIVVRDVFRPNMARNQLVALLQEIRRSWPEPDSRVRITAS